MHLLEALEAVLARVRVLGLDLVDHLALQHAALELFDLAMQRRHLVVAVRDHRIDLGHLAA